VATGSELRGAADMITGRIEVVWEELRVYREEERSKRRKRKRKVAVDERGQRPV
jgi:hypothetical protein